MRKIEALINVCIDKLAVNIWEMFIMNAASDS